MSITSRYSYIPEVVINESKIPAEVRHLLPLAKEWSISDDVELDDFIKAASREKQREFFEAFRPYFGALDKWHKELAHLVPQPDELVLFDIATNAAATVGSSLHTPKNKPENPWGESLPVKLLRDGWTPHSFPNSTVVVALPPGVTVKFDEKGVLHGFARELGRFFTATLHTNPKFTEDKALALQFVENLAKKKGA